ncbi:MAG: PTS sugar transporter subunit IIA [Treponema sp.]|nr:PTS sugar transporter subunit IIA [Treponema sp.]
MDFDMNIAELIQRGGVYFNVPGTTPEEVYKYVSHKISLPEGVDPDVLCAEICQRETLMSTAVGNGVALPHPRYPLLKCYDDQKIIVCYLDTPITMNAPDSKPVYVMMILLTSTTQSHLKILSQLAYLFQQSAFRAEMSNKPGEADLIKLIEKTVSETI